MKEKISNQVQIPSKRKNLATVLSSRGLGAVPCAWSPQSRLWKALPSCSWDPGGQGTGFRPPDTLVGLARQCGCLTAWLGVPTGLSGRAGGGGRAGAASQLFVVWGALTACICPPDSQQHLLQLWLEQTLSPCSQGRFLMPDPSAKGSARTTTAA